MDDACARLGVDCRDEENGWATCEMPMGAVLFLSNLIPHRRYKGVVLSSSSSSFHKP